jgi:hypothetical protein
VKNTLVYVKCIGTPQKVTKLQPNLQLNEHRGLFLDEKPKEVNQYGRIHNLVVTT